MVADQHFADFEFAVYFLAAEQVLERAQAGLRKLGADPKITSSMADQPKRVSPKARNAAAAIEHAIEPKILELSNANQWPIGDEEWTEASRKLLERVEKEALPLRRRAYDDFEGVEGHAVKFDEVHERATQVVADALNIELPLVNEAGIEVG